MKNKLQKWYKMNSDISWQPMYDDISYSLPNTNIQYYWTPEGKHPLEMMKLEQELNEKHNIKI